MNVPNPDSSGANGGLPGRPGSRQDSPRSIFAGNTQPGYGTHPGSGGAVPSRPSEPPAAPAPSFQSWLDARIMTADLPWVFVLVMALVVSGVLVFALPSGSPPRRKVDLTRMVAPHICGPPPVSESTGGRP